MSADNLLEGTVYRLQINYLEALCAKSVNNLPGGTVCVCVLPITYLERMYAKSCG